jgi:hypothetical protein
LKIKFMLFLGYTALFQDAILDRVT